MYRLAPLQELHIREFSFHELNANLLWPGSFAFAEWLVQHKSWIEGKHIIELGRYVLFSGTVIYILTKGLAFVFFLLRALLFLSYMQSLVSCFYATALLSISPKVYLDIYLHLILGINYHNGE